ncbi:hypothetical protein ILUMI_02459 [Ignelater luminosus]|uniref:Uncharacterized protein n=1 Tax=Ignelater luminosus TaxID=2038154 RepID=A0A8K0DGE6_IGNLU|nr:hypothetical protein ILUMI_02459 [Ignelater luminosus]
MRKKFYNENKPYCTAKEKEVAARSFNQEFRCACKRNCTDIVATEERAICFSQFWTIGSFSGRCAFIKAAVKQMIKNVFTQKKIFQNIPYKKEICKMAFLKNQNRVDVALKKYSNNMIICNGRGLKSGGKNRCTDKQIEAVIEHVNSFLKYISHYYINEINSKFPSPHLNLAKITTLVGLEDDREKEILKNAHEAHLNAAKVLRREVNRDFLKSKNNSHVETLTFDLQKTHPMPKVSSGIAYYKQQLNLYNSEFGDVEKALEVQETLYADVNYVHVMVKCKGKKKFMIVHLQADDFVSVENLIKAITGRKMDLERKKVSWFKCHEMKLHKEQLRY